MNKGKCLVALFCVVCLLNYIPTAWAQEAAQGIIRIACISNLSEMSDIQLYITNGDVYIRAEDAALLSGFQLTGQTQFSRADLSVAISSGLVFNNTYWLPLEDTLRRLKTEVDQLGGGLVFTGSKTLPQELFSLADQYMDNREVFNLISNENVLVTSGVLASLYHRLTTFSIAQSLTGEYDRKMYADLISKILKLNEDSTLLNTLSESVDISKKLTKLKAAEFGLENPTDDDWMRLYAEGKISDAGMVVSVYGDVMDPVSYFLKQAGSEYTLEGLDVCSQIELLSNIRNMINCEEFAANMLLLTYAQDALPSGMSIRDYIPNAAMDAVDDVRTFVKEMDHVNMLLEVLEEEAEHVVFSTLYEIVNDKIAIGKVPKLAAKAMGKAIDKAMPDIKSGMDYIEKVYYLSLIQEKLPALYDVYRASTLSAVNAKYTVILYLRIMQVAYELCIENGITQADNVFIQNMENALTKFASISDAELAKGNITNDKIDVHALIPIDKGSPDLIPQLREYAENCGAMNAVLCDLDFDGEPELLASTDVGHVGFWCEVVDIEDDGLHLSQYTVPLGDGLRLCRQENGKPVWIDVFDEAFQGEFVWRASILSYNPEDGVMLKEEVDTWIEDIRTVNMFEYSFPDEWINAVNDYQTLETIN